MFLIILTYTYTYTYPICDICDKYKVCFHLKVYTVYTVYTVIWAAAPR